MLTLADHHCPICKREATDKKKDYIREGLTMKSILVKRQKKQVVKTNITEYGEKCDLVIDIRYDDECGNEHNTFAITGSLYKAGRRSDSAHLAGGCIPEIIEKHAPEFALFIKWHGTTSKGPLYYIENTLYHTRGTDYNGLKKGEYGSFIKIITVETLKKGGRTEIYKTGTIYLNKQNNPNLAKSNDKEEAKLVDFMASVKPELSPKIEMIDCEYSKSEGKEIDLKAARSCAIWPEAKLEDFTKEALEARLPSLLKEFKEAMEELDFIF